MIGRRVFHAICIALGLAMFAGMAAAQMPTVAVWDIAFVQPPHDEQDRTATAADADWSVGIAGLLEQRLSEAGVRMIERQAIRCLVKEYRLDEALGDEARNGLRRKLPQVDLIITGEIRAEAGRHFDLVLRLIQGDDGQVLRTFDRTGEYPKGLEAAVAGVSQDLIAALPRNVRTLKPPPLKGFTDNPELALWFHRGIEHYFAKDYIHAAAYFDAVTDEDDQCELAKIWAIHAFRKARFDYMADAVQAALDEQRQKDAHEETIIAATQPHPRPSDGAAEPTAKWRWMIVVEPGAEHAGAVMAALLRRPDVQLVQSASLQQTIREHDVELDPAINKRTAHDVNWLSANGMAVIGPAADHRLDLRIMEISDTDVIAEQTVDPANIDLSQLWTRLDRYDREEKRQQAVTAENASLPAPTWLAEGQTIQSRETNTMWSSSAVSFAGSPIQFRAAALVALQQEPGQLDWLISDAFSNEVHLALLNRAEAILCKYPQTLHADWWLGEIGFLRMEEIFHGHWRAIPMLRRFEMEPTIAQRNAALLRLCPDSDAAMLVNYGMGREAYDRGDYRLAAALLEKLADRLPNMSLPGLDNDGIQASIWYELGRAAYADGNLTLANHAADHCRPFVTDRKKYLSWHGDLLVTRRDGGKWIVGGLWGLNKTNHAQQYDQCISERGSITREICQFIDAVDQWRAAGKRTDKLFMSDFDWFVKAINSTGELATEAHFRSLEQRLASGDAEAGGWMNDRLLKQLAMLRISVRTPAEYERFEKIARAYLPRNRRKIGLLLGDLDGMRADVEMQLKHTESNYWHGELQAIIQLNSLQYPRAEQVRLLNEYWQKWLTRSGSGQSIPDAEKCAVAETTGVALLLLGEGGQAEACFRWIAAMDNLPAAYRDHLELQLAKCEARQGHVIDATRRLTDLIQKLETVAPTTFDLSGKKDGINQWRLLSVLDSVNPTKLLNEARTVLERVRLVGGYHDLGGDTPYDVDGQADGQTASLVFACSLLMDKQWSYDQWMGGDKWDGQAMNAMLTLPVEQRVNVMRRLPLVLSPDGKVMLDNERGLEALRGLSNTSAGRDIDLRQLEYLMHNGNLCDYQRLGGRLMALTPERSRWAIPTLVLNMGKSCSSCRASFEDTLSELGAPPPMLAPSLMRMLKHGSLRVRCHAATQLARLYEYPLMQDEAGRVDDRSASRIADQLAQMPDEVSFDHAAVTGSQQATAVVATARAFGGHRQRIAVSDYSPDGRLLATADYTGLLLIRDAQSLAVHCEVHAHQGWVDAVEWAENSRELATVGRDLHVRFWRVHDDGQLELLAQMPQDVMPACIVFDPHHRGWWVLQYDHARLFSDDGKLQKDWILPTAARYQARVLPDRNEIVFQDCNNWLLRLNMESGRCAPIAQTAAWPWAFQMLDDKRLLVCAGTSLRLVPLDQITPQSMVRTTGRTDATKNSCYRMALSPDHRTVMTCDRNGRVRAFDTDAFVMKWETQLPDNPYAVAIRITPDGQRVQILDEPDRMHTLDPATGRYLGCTSDNDCYSGMTQLAMLSDHPWIATAGSGAQVIVRDRRTGCTIRRYGGHALMVNGLTALPGGTRLATIDEAGVVRIIDTNAADDAIRSCPTSQAGRAMMVRLADKHMIAVIHSPVETQGSAKNDIQWIDCDRAAVVRTVSLPFGSISVAAAAPDGALLLGTWRGELWSVPASTSHDTPPRLIHRFAHPITAISVFNGRTIRIAVGLNDGGVWISESPMQATFAFKPIAEVAAHHDRVQALTFSPDGSRLASGSRDRTLRLWNVGNPTDAAHRLPGGWVSPRNGITCLAFDENGSLVVGTYDGGLFTLNPTTDLTLIRDHAP